MKTKVYTGYFSPMFWICLACMSVTPGLLRPQIPFNADDLSKIALTEQRRGFDARKPLRDKTFDNFDVKWYGCRWNIDPAVRAISGSVTTLFKAGNGGLDTLVLDMSQALQADSVKWHGQLISKIHTDDRLRLVMPSPVASGSLDSVTVYYHGIPPNNGFGAFTTDIHNNVPVLWTLSEPYGASDWWPCRNGLTDKADSVDLYIRTPAAYRAGSNGILVSEIPVGNDKVYRWKHRYPIAAYLVCLGVTNYAVYEHQVPYGSEVLPVVNYVYPEDSAFLATQTGAIVPMLQLFDTLFGIYPFQSEKYGQLQFGWGGGMEHQTMTFLGSWGFEILAHELAHMWFGDKVTCGSWTDIWLNEGFATYLSGLCYEHLAPEWWKRFREVRIQNITRFPGGSVYCPDTTNVSRIFDSRLSYAKGAMILHQLRWLMGDGPFFSSVNSYQEDPFIRYGFARTSQLRAHLESGCNCDLGWYFDDWYTGEGYPSYHIGWTQEGSTVSFTVNQTQSHPSVSFFEMMLPVRLKNGERDTTIRIWNTHSGEQFSVQIPFQADSLLLDPDFELITSNNTIDGLPDKDGILKPDVYPNPADDHITFSLPMTGRAGTVKVFLYGHDGRMFLETGMAEGVSQLTIPTGDFPSGIYYFIIRDTKHQHSGKFIIFRNGR